MSQAKPHTTNDADRDGIFFHSLLRTDIAFHLHASGKNWYSLFSIFFLKMLTDPEGLLRRDEER
jgi:hypothetical protein